MSPTVDLRAPGAVGGEVDANALMATLAAGGLYPVGSMAALIDESALAIRLGHLGWPASLGCSANSRTIKIRSAYLSPQARCRAE